ncbi:hypothetical protein [Streptomyces olivaceiscleroticus]|uniref:hypothetical protein n=1 Tax=Streptomyces olivaceiscleroticus TaxID=68245 RepID=UPI0031F9E682
MPQEPAGRFAYDAFISYSRAADGEPARGLQHGLHAFAKPWYTFVANAEDAVSREHTLWRASHM